MTSPRLRDLLQIHNCRRILNHSHDPEGILASSSTWQGVLLDHVDDPVDVIGGFGFREHDGGDMAGR